MSEKPQDYRTKGERIAYLQAEIKRLQKLHTEPWKEEILVTCVVALNAKIARIRKEEV